jgi:hypothetical protein
MAVVANADDLLRIRELLTPRATNGSLDFEESAQLFASRMGSSAQIRG